MLIIVAKIADWLIRQLQRQPMEVSALILGPRRFIVYTNDLDTTAPMYKYVDDTTIF